ncbi:MAG TPA: M28 family peptidase [Solirubrobacterales bacterium]|nr:M28 family peptidase [Solirubrobacterales bacterium]
MTEAEGETKPWRRDGPADDEEPSAPPAGGRPEADAGPPDSAPGVLEAPAAPEGAEAELVRELCSFEGRGPGTDAERRAANMLAGRLRGLGRRAEVEPTYVHRQFALVHALHVAVAIAGSLIAVSQPAVGFALVLFAATSAYLDLNTRVYILRTLFFRRASQNVVSPGPNPAAPLRLVLLAHYDAGRSGYVYGERGRKLAERLSEPARLLLGPFRLIFWGGMVPLLPIIGARMAGVDGDWLSLIQLVPTILLIVAAFLLIDIALSETVPGAYDNASGVAAVLGAAARLRDEPPQNLDVWVVLTGGGESLSEGMRSWARRHRAGLDREHTLLVNVEGASYGTVHYRTTEGAVISYATDPELVELCEALAAAEPDEGKRALPVRSPVVSDALAARVRRMRSVSIVGADGGLAPPWLHAHEDTPERIDAAALERTTAFVVALAGLIDRGTERAAMSQAAASGDPAAHEVSP